MIKIGRIQGTQTVALGIELVASALGRTLVLWTLFIWLLLNFNIIIALFIKENYLIMFEMDK